MNLTWPFSQASWRYIESWSDSAFNRRYIVGILSKLIKSIFDKCCYWNKKLYRYRNLNIKFSWKKAKFVWCFDKKSINWIGQFRFETWSDSLVYCLNQQIPSSIDVVIEILKLYLYRNLNMKFSWKKLQNLFDVSIKIDQFSLTRPVSPVSRLYIE